MKECKTCKKLKEEEEFPFYKNRDGTKSRRNVCKLCMNEKWRTDHKKQNKTLNNKEVKNTTSVNKSLESTNMESEKLNFNMFSDEELKNLRLMAKEYQGLRQILNDRIKVYADTEKQNRIPRTINMNQDIYKRIKEYCNKTNLSISDVANELLLKALKYLD